MSNNPRLTVEFEARNESAVIASINRVSGVGQTYVEKWVADTRSATSRNEASYTSFWNKVLNEQDRATREMFAMNRARLAEQERTARAAAKIEEAASKEIVRQKKIETDALIAEGKRALDAQRSAQRQLQLAMESRVSNAGGYGPNLPSAQDLSRMATALNTGMVNAAAFLNVATSAYYMASKAVAVVSSFVLDAAKWEQMTLALENMEGGAQNAAGAIARLYEIAKAPGIDLETAQHAYLKLRAVSIQGSEAERIIKAFSNTVARGGGSSVQFGRVLEQFTQMRAENRVLQQDLKFMKNSMPELASLMQKAFGTTTAEGIRKLGLNAREFTDGILAEMEKLPKAQQTLTSEIENTGVAWSRLKAAMVDTDFTKTVLRDFTNTFESITKVLNAKSVDWKRLIMGIWGGHGVEYGAYAGGREKDFAEVNSFFDKIEAKATISGVKAKAGKNYRATDSSGKTRTDWLTFVQSKWDKADAARLAATTPPVVTPSEKEDEKKKKASTGGVDLGWNDPKRVKAAKDYANDLARVEKERRERSAKEFQEAREVEFAANKAHQKRVDDWNQAQIDKNREKNQAGNSLLGEIDPLRAIENEYVSHYERINEANFASEEERARVNAQFRLKEQAAIREFHAAQYSIAVSGASDMFGALAELRKNATSESNGAYQVLFGISKAFAIADATIKLSSAAINAMAVGSSQGIPVMLANIGTVMATGGGLISQINSTAYSGVFDKGGAIGAGKWGIAGENGPEIIQGPAHVTSTRDTARLVGAGGGTKVVVNNYAGASVSTKMNSNGEMEILIQRAAEVAEDRIASGIASGGGKVGRQISNTFGVKR